MVQLTDGLRTMHLWYAVVVCIGGMHSWWYAFVVCIGGGSAAYGVG